MRSAKHRQLIALLLFCLFYLALAVFSELWLLRETEGRIADDFGIYYQAYLRAQVGENPYSPYKIGLSFVYHPIALTWISIFDWSGVRLAAILWMAAGALAWISSLMVAIHVLRKHLVQQPGHPMHPPRIWLAVFLLLAFGPAWETIHMGQINGFVVLCLVLAYYFSQREGLVWEITSAVAFSLAVLFKTSPIVLVLYFLSLHRYRPVLFSVSSMLLMSAIPAIQFSPRLLSDFSSTVLRIGSGIHYSYHNHSALRIGSQLLRRFGLQGIDGILMLLFQATSGLLFGLFSLSTWLRVTRPVRANVLLFSLMLSLMVVASPIVWYHHNALLLFPILATILHPDQRVRALGLVALLLIQSERALEGLGYPAGRAALVGQTIILLTLVLLYTSDRWPALKTRLSRVPTLWQRYSGGV